MSNARIGVARDKARKLLKELKITTIPVPLNPIVKHLSINTAPHDIDDKLSGVTAYDSETDENYILYNKSHHVHRQRFTVAHEVGHVVFEHPNYQNESLDFNSKDDREIEANQFAAELLMPLDKIKSDIVMLGTVKKMAYKYWVSEEAMFWRLDDAKLLNKLYSWN